MVVNVFEEKTTISREGNIHVHLGDRAELVLLKDAELVLFVGRHYIWSGLVLSSSKRTM